MPNVGDRVLAIRNSEGDKVYIYGEGVYEGDFVPGEEVRGFMGEALREHSIANPRIKLDNGDVVYGCECWWGAVEAANKKIPKDWERIEVKIADSRKEADEEDGEENNG